MILETGKQVQVVGGQPAAFIISSPTHICCCTSTPVYNQQKYLKMQCKREVWEAGMRGRGRKRQNELRGFKSLRWGEVQIRGLMHIVRGSWGMHGVRGEKCNRSMR